MSREFAEAGGIVSALSALAWFLLENVDQVLSWLVPLTYRVAPRVGWLDQQFLERAIFALSVILVAWRLARFARSAVERVR